MNVKTMISMLTVTTMMVSCGGNSNNKTEMKTEKSDSATISFSDCDMTLGGIHFTKMLNGADTMTTEKDGIITMRSLKGQDMINPADGSAATQTSPFLLAELDNTKPFTIVARIRPQFTQNGTYNGGVLALYENDQHWQKFCFEQDERGNHRVVIVRTVGTSDDNNYEPITGQDYVYYKFSSDTKQIGCYFSRDGKKWILVRVHNNNYPANIYYGISSQCPKVDTQFISEFSEISLTHDAVKDFRMGE